MSGNNVVPYEKRGTALRPYERSSGPLRTPPHSREAEQALLGAIFMDNRAFDAVADMLQQDHFADPACGRVFGVVRALVESGAAANPVTVGPYLAFDDVVEQAGGPKFLAGLMAGAVTVKNARQYGQTIYDLYLRREMINLGDAMVTAGFDVRTDQTAEQAIDEVEHRLFELTALGTRSDTNVSVKVAAEKAIELAQAAHRREGGVIGTPSGLRDVDRLMSGLHPTDLVILAGRPSMGKTALATNIAVNAATYFRDTQQVEDQNKFVAFFSLEMSAEQLANRVLAEMADVDSHKIRTGGLSGDEFERLVGKAGTLEGLPLEIDDAPGITVSAMRVRVRRLSRKLRRKCGLIVMDYLQLGSSPGAENRTQEVSSITRGLKALAKALGVPVLALSQLSRQLESREDKRPQLADLRESGTIEQDADAVLFVYREQYYLERNQPQQRGEESAERFHARQVQFNQRLEACHNTAEVIIGKQRHGPIGTVKLGFNPGRTRFFDLETRHADAAAVNEAAPGPAQPEQTAFELGSAPHDRR